MRTQPSIGQCFYGKNQREGKNEAVLGAFLCPLPPPRLLNQVSAASLLSYFNVSRTFWVKTEVFNIFRFRVGTAHPTIFPDTSYPHSIESGCTIVLLTKKIKKFISIPHKHLSIFAKEKIGHFRMRDASSCKG
jgi:hypothetical protein